jgi:hypothetical protein
LPSLKINRNAKALRRQADRTKRRAGRRTLYPYRLRFLIDFNIPIIKDGVRSMIGAFWLGDFAPWRFIQKCMDATEV